MCCVVLRCVADIAVDIRRFDADIIPLEGAAGLLEFESSNIQYSNFKAQLARACPTPVN